jgi:hypothetical protein
MCLLSGIGSLINIAELKLIKVTPASAGVPWCLTQALMTTDGCIKMSGLGSQALIARVEHAAGQMAQGAHPAPTRTVFAVAKLVDWDPQEAL